MELSCFSMLMLLLEIGFKDEMSGCGVVMFQYACVVD